jgi:pilus assembly protein Flp/PilA
LFCCLPKFCGTNTRDRAGHAQPVIIISSSTLKDLLIMRNLLTRFAKNEEGAALIEYGMLVGLIAVVCVAAVGTLGQTILGYFTAINAAL